MSTSKKIQKFNSSLPHSEVLRNCEELFSCLNLRLTQSNDIQSIIKTIRVYSKQIKLSIKRKMPHYVRPQNKDGAMVDTDLSIAMAVKVKVDMYTATPCKNK